MKTSSSWLRCSTECQLCLTVSVRRKPTRTVQYLNKNSDSRLLCMFYKIVTRIFSNLTSKMLKIYFQQPDSRNDENQISSSSFEKDYVNISHEIKMRTRSKHYNDSRTQKTRKLNDILSSAAVLVAKSP